MTVRSASWAGSAGAAWPALSTGDTWGSGFWASPSKTVEQYDSITSTITGSGTGSITGSYNRAVVAKVISPAASTNASSAGRYNFSAGVPAASSVNLVYVCTTWTAAHYHQIASASCTNGWLNLTYDLVTSYDWVNSGIYFRMSVFRTVAGASGSSGNIAVDVYDTATSAIVATQATGYTAATIGLYGCDTTSNGVNAVRAANTTTNTATTGQPNVTLPNNLSKYSSLPIAFFASAANTPTFASSSDSNLVTSGSYTTPVNAMSIYSRTQPSTVAAVKTQRTMTANLSISNVKWGAIGIEVLRSTSQDTYLDLLNDYTYVRIAGNSVQPQYQATEVRASVDPADPWGPYAGLIGRYVTSGATKYWLGTSVVSNAAKAEGQAYIYAVVDNGTTTTATQVAFSSGAGNFYDIYDRMAMRVRVLPSGDLWVSAKYWASSGAEPAWPTLSSDVSTAQVVNGVYSTNDPLRNATAGQTGLYCVQPSTASTTLSNGGWAGPADGTVTKTWTAWTNSDWIVAATSASISGGGSVVAANGRRIAQGTASIPGGGSISSTGTRVALGSAAVAGGGSLSVVGLHIDIAFAILDGGGSVTSSGIAIQSVQAAPADITLSSPPPSVSLVGVAEVATMSFAGQDGDISLLPITALADNANLATSSDLGSTTLAPLGVAATQAVLTFSPQLGTATCLVAAIGLPPQILFDAQLALIIQGMLDVFGLAVGHPRGAMKIQGPSSSHLAGDARAFWRVRGVTRQ